MQVVYIYTIYMHLVGILILVRVRACVCVCVCVLGGKMRGGQNVFELLALVFYREKLFKCTQICDH